MANAARAYNKRLNTQKYPAFVDKQINTDFASYFAAEAAAADTSEAASFTIEAPAAIASEAAALTPEAAESTAACALEAASIAALCAAEAADAPSAATAEAASFTAEAAWLAVAFSSPQAANIKDNIATDSSDFFMFNTFNYFYIVESKAKRVRKIHHYRALLAAKGAHCA
nr:hypothetical protein [uncultured Kingella sp.]